jgi:hypothetical protein
MRFEAIDPRREADAKACMRFGSLRGLNRAADRTVCAATQSMIIARFGGSSIFSLEESLTVVNGSR